MADNNIQEHVISLMAKVDESGMTKLLGYLDTSKLKSLGMMAAISGLTTAIYKFVESTTKQEFALRELAGQQHKSVEATYAQNTALKAMGMTLKDIKKDKALKSIYDDIVKTNRAMGMPNMEPLLKNVNELRGAFWKLKSVISVAVRWVNAKVLKNIESTMERITGKLNDISGWVQKNLNPITSKIASALSDFIIGVTTIAEGVGRISDFFMNLPDSIKVVAGSVAGIALLLKSGPIGQLLAVIELIGEVRRDYDNWHKHVVEGNEEYAGTYGLDWIWGNLGDRETIIKEGGKRFSFLLDTIIGGLTEATNALAESNTMSDLWGSASENGGGTGIIGAIFSFISNNKEKLKELGGAIFRVLQEAIGEAGGVAGGGIAKILNSLLGADENGNSVIPDSFWEDEGQGTTLATTFGGFFGTFFDKLGKGGKLTEAFKAGLGGGVLGLLIGALTQSLTLKDEKAGLSLDNIDWDTTLKNLKINVSGVGEIVKGVLGRAISGIDGLGSFIFSEIAAALDKDPSIEDESALDPLSNVFTTLSGPESVIGKAITRGMTAGFTLGGPAGLIAAITTVITEAIKNPDQFLTEINTLGTELGKFFDILWNGTNVYNHGAVHHKRGLKDLLGVGEEGGGLLGWIQDIWNSVVQFWDDTIYPFLQEAFDSIGQYIAIVFYDNVYQSIKQLINSLGLEMPTIENPHTSTIEDEVDSNGQVHHILKSTNGREKELSDDEFNYFTSNSKYVVGDSGKGNKTQFSLSLDDDNNIVGTKGNTVWGTKDNIKNLVEEDRETNENAEKKGVTPVRIDVRNEMNLPSVNSSMPELNLDENGALPPDEHRGGSDEFNPFWQPPSNTQGNAGYTRLSDMPVRTRAGFGVVSDTSISSTIAETEEDRKKKTELTTQAEDGRKKATEESMRTEQSHTGAVRESIDSLADFVDLMDGASDAHEHLQDESVESAAALTALTGGAIVAVRGLTDLFAVSGGVSQEFVNLLTGLNGNGGLTDAIDTLIDSLDGGKNSLTNKLSISKDALDALKTSLTGKGNVTDALDTLKASLSGKGGASDALGVLKESLVGKGNATDALGLLKTNAGNVSTAAGTLKSKFDKLNANVGDDSSGFTSKLKGLIDKVGGQSGVNNALQNFIGKIGGDNSGATLSVRQLGNEASSTKGKISDMGSKAGDFNSAMEALKKASKAAAENLQNLKDDFSKKAWGGRIGSEQNNLTVGEDGTEYIIPITKPERAFSLINQMFNEMGTAAFDRVVSDFGVPGTVGGAIMKGSATMGSVVMMNTYNIHAPVSIVVNSSAASAEDVGSAAYNAAERHLVKTLRGVYA